MPNTHVPCVEENSLIQFISWNTQGKSWSQTLQVLDDAEVDSHIVALQECSDPRGDAGGKPRNDDNNPVACQVASGFVVFTCKPSGCHRQLAFCFDETWEGRWSRFQVGHSHVSVHIQMQNKQVVLVNAHLPHSGRPLGDMLQACESLITSLMPVVEKQVPIVFLGDLNFDIHREEASSERGFAVCSALEMLGLTILSDNKTQTWRHKTLDYVMCNNSFASLVLHVNPGSGEPWGDYVVRPDLQATLGVDHACVMCDSLLPAPLKQSKKTRAMYWSRIPRKMYVARPDEVEAFCQTACHSQSFDDRFISLKSLAGRATVPRRSLRYVDPSEVKSLIRQRSKCFDSAKRKLLSFEISRARAAAKHVWKLELVRRAASGDWLAKKLLTKRDSLHAALWPMVLVHDGDKGKVVDLVAAHFQAQFGRDELVDLPGLFAGLNDDDEGTFSLEEVSVCLSSMKANKTSGMSKMSVELFKSIAAYEGGLQSLKHILDDILQDPCLLQKHDLLTGWVILLPKKSQVLDASMLRPIVLGEVLAKLLSKLCIRRLLSNWPTPKSCFGSVRGRGVADAAFLTSIAVREAVIMGAPVVAVKLDISGAYDNFEAFGGAWMACPAMEQLHG